MGMLGFLGRTKKKFVLTDLMMDPEKYELNMYFEKEEVVIKIRKRVVEDPTPDVTEQDLSES